ncbi:MAG TPA: photosystem II reaction center protein Ycf12 [Cyanophyceae cyanobacterium]
MALLGFLGIDLSFLGSINWEVIAQLTMLAMIVLAGPAVIFALAALKGDL